MDGQVPRHRRVRRPDGRHRTSPQPRMSSGLRVRQGSRTAKRADRYSRRAADGSPDPPTRTWPLALAERRARCRDLSSSESWRTRPPWRKTREGASAVRVAHLGGQLLDARRPGSWDPAGAMRCNGMHPVSWCPRTERHRLHLGLAARSLARLDPHLCEISGILTRPLRQDAGHG